MKALSFSQRDGFADVHLDVADLPHESGADEQWRAMSEWAHKVGLTNVGGDGDGQIDRYMWHVDVYAVAEDCKISWAFVLVVNDNSGDEHEVIAVAGWADCFALRIQLAPLLVAKALHKLSEINDSIDRIADRGGER